MNLYEYFRHRRRTAPDETAIHEPSGENRDYEDVDDMATRIAAWITDRGLEDSDRVGVYLPDCPEYVPVILGIWRAGCVATPLNTRFERTERREVLADVEPSALIRDRDGPDLAGPVETHLPIRPLGWFGDSDLPPATVAPPPATRFDDDTAIVMHTSGSTGTPKGVVQTHRNVSAQVDAGIARFQVTDDDVGLVAVPLFHVGGMHEIVLMSLFAGGSVAVLPKWDPVDWARLVEETGATWSGLVPAMMIDVLESDDALDIDISSLRFCIYGGSPTAESILEAFESETGVGNLIDNYGQTESAGVSVTYGADERRRPGAMGTPTAAVKARIVDLDTGDAVPPDTAGELLLRGDSITSGYWNRSDANDDLFTDGWFHTDDLVRRDEDGYLYYVDRVDNVVLSGGEKVSPSEVENVLQEHPEISSVAVFGTPHDRYGQAVTAAIVTEDDSLSAADIVAFCDESDVLAGYKKPRRIAFVDEFPRTGSHKVDKTALLDWIDDWTEAK